MRRKITADTVRDPSYFTRVEGYVDGLEFTPKQYRSVVFDYLFDVPVKCCIMRDGCKCNTPHNYGFAIRLADGSVSVVGNECVGRLANDAAISTGIREYLNSQDLKQKEELIRQRVGEDYRSFEDVFVVRERLVQARKFVTAFMAITPRRMNAGLIRMIRSRRDDIRVHAIEDFESDPFLLVVSGFEDIGFLDSSTSLTPIICKMSTSVGYHKRYLEKRGDLSSKDISAIANAIKGDSRLLDEGRATLERFEKIKGNDFKQLVWLSPDRKEQVDYLVSLSKHFGLGINSPNRELGRMRSSILHRYNIVDFQSE